MIAFGERGGVVISNNGDECVAMNDTVSYFSNVGYKCSGQQT